MADASNVVASNLNDCFSELLDLLVEMQDRKINIPKSFVSDTTSTPSLTAVKQPSDQIARASVAEPILRQTRGSLPLASEVHQLSRKPGSASPPNALVASATINSTLTLSPVASPVPIGNPLKTSSLDSVFGLGKSKAASSKRKSGNGSNLANIPVKVAILSGKEFSKKLPLEELTNGYAITELFLKILFNSNDGMPCMEKLFATMRAKFWKKYKANEHRTVSKSILAITGILRRLANLQSMLQEGSAIMQIMAKLKYEMNEAAKLEINRLHYYIANDGYNTFIDIYYYIKQCPKVIVNEEMKQLVTEIQQIVPAWLGSAEFRRFLSSSSLVAEEATTAVLLEELKRKLFTTEINAPDLETIRYVGLLLTRVIQERDKSNEIGKEELLQQWRKNWAAAITDSLNKAIDDCFAMDGTINSIEQVVAKIQSGGEFKEFDSDTNVVLICQKFQQGIAKLQRASCTTTSSSQPMCFSDNGASATSIAVRNSLPPASSSSSMAAIPVKPSKKRHSFSPSTSAKGDK